MRNKQTLIDWKNIMETTPRIDIDCRGSEKKMLYSEIVLVTDGNSIYEARYIFNWEDFEENKKYSLKWELELLSNHYLHVIYWCSLDDIKLPQPPKVNLNKNVEIEKKYTLKQLRQAWAAGKYDMS